MKQRCNNPRHTAASWYHDAGIRVCAEWNDSFECFQLWATQNGYYDGATIDRIDPDKNYSPENCRWISIEENRNRARRRKKYKENINGHTKKGRFMVVKHPLLGAYVDPVVVIKTGLSKKAAGEYIKELVGDRSWEERDYSIFVTDNHKEGETVLPEKCRYYLNKKK